MGVNRCFAFDYLVKNCQILVCQNTKRQVNAVKNEMSVSKPSVPPLVGRASGIETLQNYKKNIDNPNQIGNICTFADR